MHTVYCPSPKGKGKWKWFCPWVFVLFVSKISFILPLLLESFLFKTTATANWHLPTQKMVGTYCSFDSNELKLVVVGADSHSQYILTLVGNLKLVLKVIVKISPLSFSLHKMIWFIVHESEMWLFDENFVFIFSYPLWDSNISTKLVANGGCTKCCVIGHILVEVFAYGNWLQWNFSMKAASAKELLTEAVLKCSHHCSCSSKNDKDSQIKFQKIVTELMEEDPTVSVQGGDSVETQPALWGCTNQEEVCLFLAA